MYRIIEMEDIVVNFITVNISLLYDNTGTVEYYIRQDRIWHFGKPVYDIDNEYKKRLHCKLMLEGNWW